VILVIAEPGDQGASALVAELAPRPALAVSWVDFAAAPSCLHHPHFEDSRVTVAGAALSVAAIRGVVNALPAVIPESLDLYDATEREYQAAELHAWLSYFLSALTCTVVNRPSALSLAGPVLNPLGWLHLARAAGIPVAARVVSSDDLATARSVAADRTEPVIWVSGMEARTAAQEHTATLARRSGVAYLEAWFEDDGAGGVRLKGASSLPDLASQRSRRAIVAALGP
jgi:hypothetical protein